MTRWFVLVREQGRGHRWRHYATCRTREEAHLIMAASTRDHRPSPHMERRATQEWEDKG